MYDIIRCSVQHDANLTVNVGTNLVPYFCVVQVCTGLGSEEGQTERRRRSPQGDPDGGGNARHRFINRKPSRVFLFSQKASDFLYFLFCFSIKSFVCKY